MLNKISSSIPFPTLKLTETPVTEYDKTIIVSNLYKDVVYTVEVGVKDGIIYITKTEILPFQEFKDYLKLTNKTIYIGYCYFIQEYISDIFTKEERKKFKLVSFKNDSNKFTRDGINIIYAINKQTTLDLMSTMIKEDKLFICKHLPSEHISMIENTFNKLKYSKTQYGHKRWLTKYYEYGIESSLDFDCKSEPFQFCIIYAIGLLTGKTF